MLSKLAWESERDFCSISRLRDPPGDHERRRSELLRSRDADIYPINDPSAADEIEGAIGDGSHFHDA